MQNFPFIYSSPNILTVMLNIVKLSYFFLNNYIDSVLYINMLNSSTHMNTKLTDNNMQRNKRNITQVSEW